MKKFYFLFLFALIASISNLYAAEVTDVITASDLKATGTNYKLFSDVKGTSGAVYAGQSAQTANNSGIIQLNNDKKNGRNVGIVSTASGGLIKSVSIEVDKSNKKTYSVYVKKTAYSVIEDLYGTNTKQGDLILESSSTNSVDVTGEYYYIGIRSKSGAVKISKITITYVNSSVATPTITPNGGDVNVGDKITFATKTDGATLSYSTDEGQTWTQGSEYTAVKAGALNLWVKATKDSDESAVAKATFNVVDPNAISVNINITADKTAATGELFGTMTVAVPMPINATEMDVVIKKDGIEFSSNKGLTAEFSKEITETGTYEIDVTANNDNEITEDTKTAKFYSNKLTDIADFLRYGPECNNLFGSDVVYEFTCPLSVTFSNGENLWVTDGTDGMLIFKKGGFSTAYTNGTVFAKGIKGQYTVYNNTTIELAEPVLTETTEGATIDPKQIEIAAIKAENQNQYVIIKDAVLNVENKTFADAAGNTVDMFNKGFCTVPADGTYDVVGIVSYYKPKKDEATTQVYPLAFLTAPTATLGFTAAEINEMPWLAANDIVLTEDGSFEDMNASCVKLTCEEGAQIEYTLDSGEPSPSTATVESGTEIGFTDGESYMLTVCAVKGGYKSASREYVFSIGKTSSVSSMSAEGVKVVAAEGGVKVVADEAAEVAVYTAAGQLVRQARVAEGSTLVNVAPGFYVVRANGTATKVIVR